jgi:hypothetical protein
VRNSKLLKPYRGDLMKRFRVFVGIISLLFVPYTVTAQTPVEEKVGVLITGWGMPSGYSFHYSYYSSQYPRCGDLTEYEGQPCKLNHVGEFPYQSHVNIIPFSICFEQPEPERALLWDNHGIYKLENGVYLSPNPDIPTLKPGDIPSGVPITPLVEVVGRDGTLTWPADPRNGENYLEGWFMVGEFDNPLPNGYPDLYEQGPAYYVRYYGHITSPADPNIWPYTPPFVQEQEELTQQMLTTAFGDRIDVRTGFYGEVPGYTKLHWDVAEEFSKEGFTKLLLARETTDNNRYANDFMTGGYVKERLCELGTLDDIEIHQTRQVGRTPEFNAMNVINLQPYIEAYPEGSKIAIVYVTRGLPWGGEETTGWFGSAHPWSKETYFENAYLNYLSFKEAIQRAYGDRYNLVFTKGGVESDIMENNFFTFGLSEEPDLLGFGGETIFYSIRNAIQLAKEDGIDKIIVAPCHWNYDNLDTILRMKEINGLPLTPLTDLEAEIFEMTHCEDSDVNEVSCNSPQAVAEITVAPSYSHRAQEFATSYYQVLRGTLEQFGLYPQGEEPVIEASQVITKLAGGTVEVTTGTIQGARIEIPGDPYPERPEEFTPETAIPVNDPADSYDCMWEDTEIIIGYQKSPPPMTVADPVGPAVHFGPYRTFFNRDVTIAIPYEGTIAGGKGATGVYIYNHVTEDWDPIEIETLNSAGKLATFKTQVLGLFQVALKPCPVEQLYGQESEQANLLRKFRDHILNATDGGKALTSLYYEWSPTITLLMKKDKHFKMRIQKLLEEFLPLVKTALQ